MNEEPELYIVEGKIYRKCLVCYKKVLEKNWESHASSESHSRKEEKKKNSKKGIPQYKITHCDFCNMDIKNYASHKLSKKHLSNVSFGESSQSSLNTSPLHNPQSIPLSEK